MRTWENSKLEITPVLYTLLYQWLTFSRASAANLSAMDSAVATSAVEPPIRHSDISIVLPH